MTAKELVALIEGVGRVKDRQKGSHAVYKDPSSMPTGEGLLFKTRGEGL